MTSGESPYIHFDDPFTFEILPHDIDADNEDKRIRVYCSQLLETIIDRLNQKDYLFHASVYQKLGRNLLEKYPHRYEELFNANLILWEKVQRKIKENK